MGVKGSIPARRHSLQADGLSGALWLGLRGSLAERARVVAASAERSALKGALRGVLHYHLGHQPLRSREVLHQAHDLLQL